MRKFPSKKPLKSTARIAAYFTAILAVFFIAILLAFHLLMTDNIRKRAEEALRSLQREYTYNMSLENQDLDPGSGEETETEAGHYGTILPSMPLEASETETGSDAAQTGTGTETGADTAQAGTGTETESESLYEQDESSLMAVSFLVDQNYRTEFYISAREKLLAEWCKNNPIPNDMVIEAEVGKRDYYILTMKDRFFGDFDKYRWILYVDVTPQKNLIAMVESIELFIMLICAAVAAMAGFKLGTSLEREQEKQKQFFENASHELKTPLMSIQGYAEGIQTGVIPDAGKAAGYIISEADKMRNLVEEILSLSRLESKGMKLHPDIVKVSDLVNDCLMSLEFSIRKRGLNVSMNLDETRIPADPDQFERVVINLISNAVKYARSKITIICTKTELKVVNDGEALTEEELEHVFDRFYIGTRGSTGIGLALAREIVEKHGWKITARNETDGIAFIVSYRAARM